MERHRPALGLLKAIAASIMIVFLMPLVSGQECLYEYLREPPSESLIDCNPYSSTSDLVLQCRVSVPTSEVGNAEIRWFNEGQQITLEGFYPLARVNGIVVELENGTDRSIITSTLNLDGERFLTQPDQPGGGSYHCQIVVDGNNSTAISNQLVIDSNQETYSGNGDCSSSTTYFEENMRCAKSSPTTTSAAATTTTPATPTTADSNTTDSVILPNTTAPLITAPPATSTTTSTTGGPGLQVWVYVLVAIAAVFGMIIVVLAILCVGLCLKKNKTEDTNKQKGVEEQFTSNSMVSNGLYQRKGEEGITSGTHVSSHSQISDYSTLQERNYEVIEVVVDSDKQDYHHLQRPSPPMLPNERGTNFNFTPPKEFNSMSTLTSQLGGTPGSREMFQYGKLMNSSGSSGGTLPNGPDGHVYRELEHVDSGQGPQVKDIYRSPTESDQFFSHRGTLPSDSVRFGFHNEGLYSPNFDSSLSSRVQPGGLENVPETGTMFSEPQNPTAFPVHQYEKISRENEGPQYETPITSRAKTMTTSSSATPINAAPPVTTIGSRSRMNSGARYETEVAQIQQTETEESPYNKLRRPSGAQPSSVTHPMYSELRSQESEGSLCLDKHMLPHSHSSAELQRQQDTVASRNAHANKGFTVPAHMMSMAPGGVGDVSSTLSPIDSLSSYATRLQEGDALMTDNQIDGALFNEQGSGNSQSALMEHQHHRSCQRNPSLERPPRGGGGGAGENRKSGLRHDQRAWSEEPVQPFTNGRLVPSGFSGSTALTGYSRHDNVVSPPTTCRDVRVNGMDMRLGEYTRSKTMV